MRLRGVYLLLAVAASVGTMLVLAGPAVASNLTCGEVLTSSTTLIGNLDCSGTSAPALFIGADDVTLNLNGYTVTGHTGDPVIFNYDASSSSWHNGTVIKNGTIHVGGPGTGFDNAGGGSGNYLDVVNIVGNSAGGSVGVLSNSASGLTFLDGSVSGIDIGFWLTHDTGDTIKNSTIKTCNSAAGGSNTCAASDGVFSGGDLTTITITGNAFTSDAAQTGTAYHASYDAGTVFSRNTVTGLEYGVYADNYTAGLMITSNVFGGANPADGLDTAVYMPGNPSGSHSHGDVISSNFIRNSFDYGVEDLNSFNNTYVGNIATANGRASDDYTFDIEPDRDGPVTMVDNVARLGYSAGFYINGAYSDSVSGPPYSVFSGNSAIANGTDGSAGFYDFRSVGSTWKSNTAKYNAHDGFVFEQPWREIVNGNTSSMNGDDGFLFYDVSANAQPLAVTNNTASYNGGYGFTGAEDDPAEPGYLGSDVYPVSGSGNSGGGTNGVADCYLVAGCS